MAEIDGPGALQHMWMTTAPERWRRLIFRIYWAASVYMPADVDWHEALRVQLEQERESTEVGAAPAVATAAD